MVHSILFENSFKAQLKVLSLTIVWQSLTIFFFLFLLFVLFCFVLFFQLTEIGLTGQSGHCVHRFVMAENKHDTGSAITQLHYMVVKTVRAIREIQELVTFLSVQVRP